MADGIVLNPGVGGDTVAADDVAGAKHQRVKLSLGADGTAADAPVGGGVEAGVLRVTLASDSTGVLSVDDNGGSLTVDGSVSVSAISAGDNNIGNVDVVTLPALVAGTANIGDVDVLTVPADPFGANADAASATGSISAKLRFIAATGIPVTSIAAGNNNIGDVDIASALPAGTNNIGDVDIASALPAGTNNIGDVDVLTLPALVAGTANIGDVDVLTVVPGTGATNLGKAEDEIHASGDVGVMALAVRQDAQTALAADGDYLPPTIDAVGGLRVSIVAGAPSGGTAMTDDAVFTPGATTITPMGGMFDDVAPDSVNEGDGGVVRMSANRNLYVNIRDAAGNERGLNIDAAGALAVAAHAVTNAGTFAVQVGALPAGTNNIGDVDVLTLPALVAGTAAIGKLAANTGVDIGDVDVTSVIPGTGATNAGKAVDSVAGATDTGTAILAIRDDALTTLTPVDGDYVPFRVNSTGALHVTGAGGGTQFAEDAAHASGDIGTMALAVRKDTGGTLAATDGDYVPLQTDANGYLRIAIAAGGIPGVIEDAASAGAEEGIMAMAVRRDTAASSSGTDGDFSTLNVNASGRLYTASTLDAAIPAGTNNIGDVDVLSLVPGTAATSLGKAEDAAHTTGDVGVMALAVRQDTLSALATTTGDYAPLQVDANGSLRATLSSMLVDDAGYTPGTSTVNMAGFQADETTTDNVDEGDAGAARMTLDRKLIVNPQPHSAGGLSIFRSIDLDEGTLEVVKNAPGCLYGAWVTNTATTTRWIKFYDAVSGTAGTGTPVITIGIPGNATDDISGILGAGGMGVTFATGICVGATTGVADADTGAPGANEVIVNIFFK